MGECGCSGNSERFKFPGPKKLLYVMTLYPGCQYCDAAPGVTIEKFEPTDGMYSIFDDDDDFASPLVFEKWSDSQGAHIGTAFRKEEFVKALSKHLVGTDPSDLTGDAGLIDDIGAEELLSEMFEDAQKRPELTLAKSQPQGA